MGGSLDSFASGKLSGFDMGYSGIQFGGDKRLSDVMPLYVGLYIGSTHASPDYSGGDGTAPFRLHGNVRQLHGTKRFLQRSRYKSIAPEK
ncbi:outer membrane autotransporter [Escherichia coli]|uniref:Outer membrane autotransporter n=1 Tax=Escherichia coli TaxID=562 RepID=A0A376TIM3_ECOLX|nr:outer membrane autotransporter [Escherichia coli]